VARLTDGLLSAKPANQIECERNGAESTPNIRCVSMFNYLHQVQTSMLFVSGWQRVSSYDQLSSSSLLSSHSRPFSSKPSSFSRPHSRARLSEPRIPAPDITNLDLPLFNKTNPMQFLDIMKGVSARLNENAGVRPRKEFNSGASLSSQAKKRTRGVSLGSTSELPGKATRGIVKKGRIDELRTSSTFTWNEGKGKGRATFENEGLNSEVRGRGLLQAHSSLPDIPSRSDLKRSFLSKDVSFMDDDMDVEHAVSSSSNHGYPDTIFARTLSQTKMPPPPFPSDSFAHKQCQPTTDTPPQQSNNISSISTPVSRHSYSINKPQTLYPPPQQPPTNYSIKQRKPDAIPRLHPLLYHKPATTKVSSSSVVTSTPQVQPQHHPAPIPASEGLNLQPPSPSFTPLFTSTPSARPPPLGMRRNHTFPSRTSSSSTVQQGPSSLPQRQKGFKPPLLSLSQPQTQTQTHSLSRVNSNTNVIAVESGSTIATSKNISSQNLPEASSTDDHGFNSKSNKCNQGPAQQPQASDVIPEPLDGDADSSFGDMSFDMDALEETMKMYD
jgi:hypothetical protein